jgi:hypothetical protein
MKKMSKEAEARILDALNGVAEVVNDGGDPDKAIIKAAQDHDVPAGHIALMVSAYNTGRTNKQRMAHDDPAEKSASFKLADTKKVLEVLYPSEVKTAGQQEYDSAVSSQYSRPPDFSREKAASAVASREIDWKMVDKPEEYSGEAHTLMKKAYEQSVFADRRLLNCRREISRANDLLVGAFEKLGAYFRTPGNVSFNDARTAVEIQHGNMGRAIMNQVARHAPFLEKQGATGRAFAVTSWSEPFATINECVEMANVLRKRDGDFKELSSHVTKKAETVLAPFVPGSETKSVLGIPSSGPPEKRGIAKALLGFAALSKLVGGMRGPVESSEAKSKNKFESEVQDIGQALADPTHDNELRGIKIRALLEDLMSNDPVISGYDPEEVIDAYNEIITASPRAGEQKILLRGLMRRHLSGEGATDPFDVQQNIMGSEQSLKDIDALETGVISPGTLVPGATLNKAPTIAESGTSSNPFETAGQMVAETFPSAPGGAGAGGGGGRELTPQELAMQDAKLQSELHRTSVLDPLRESEARIKAQQLITGGQRATTRAEGEQSLLESRLETEEARRDEMTRRTP